MDVGTPGLQMSEELLKLLATVFVLFISTVTVEFRIAAFINTKRDAFPDRRTGKLTTFGEAYDWFWGYLLGLLVNIVFFLVARQVWILTRQSDYTGIGNWVFWLYLLNLVLWCGGFIVDFLRLCFPGGKQEAVQASAATVVTKTTITTETKEG